jgi:hypothetical protein
MTGWPLSRWEWPEHNAKLKAPIWRPLQQPSPQAAGRRLGFFIDHAFGADPSWAVDASPAKLLLPAPHPAIRVALIRYDHRARESPVCGTFFAEGRSGGVSGTLRYRTAANGILYLQ